MACSWAVVLAAQLGMGLLPPSTLIRLSPAVNNYPSEASRQEVRNIFNVSSVRLETLMQPQGTPENGYLWQKVNYQLSSPSRESIPCLDMAK
uniref:Uncharacterized protein n=1 Tax=Quercus lobata TaxID=97700 RepID=A0A7N2LL48_QUELO